MKRIAVIEANTRKEVHYFKYTKELSDVDNLNLCAMYWIQGGMGQQGGKEPCTKYGPHALNSVHWYRTNEVLRVSPYTITYTKSGNIKYAGQRKSDFSNPDYFDLIVVE